MCDCNPERTVICCELEQQLAAKDKEIERLKGCIRKICTSFPVATLENLAVFVHWKEELENQYGKEFWKEKAGEQ